MNINNSKGASAVEFTLVLPIAVLLIAAALGISLTGVRGIVAQLAAVRAARVASVFQDDLIDAELYAALPPVGFRGGFAEISGERLITNELPGTLEVIAVPSGVLDFEGLRMSLHRRDARITPVLPRGLNEGALRGGDTPSPYCRDDGGYSVCGYEE
jgi:hypothetical protein